MVNFDIFFILSSNDIQIRIENLLKIFKKASVDGTKKTIIIKSKRFNKKTKRDDKRNNLNTKANTRNALRLYLAQLSSTRQILRTTTSSRAVRMVMLDATIYFKQEQYFLYQIG